MFSLCAPYCMPTLNRYLSNNRERTVPSAVFFQQAVISCRSPPRLSTDQQQGEVRQAIKNITIRRSFFFHYFVSVASSIVPFPL